MEFKLIESPIKDKKWRGIFIDSDGKETHIDFGQVGYEDLTQHKNMLRRSHYIVRHRANETWNNPKTAGALSRWILWETPSLQTNIRLFKQKFNLK
jgi:hypothetical protein